MSKNICICKKEMLDQQKIVDRNTFYEEREIAFKDRYVILIDIFLFNTHGEILLQKRSKRKTNNPGMLHTSVGGHVDPHDTIEFTAIHECLDETGIPAILIPREQNFTKSIQKLSGHIGHIAIIQQQKQYFRTLKKFITPDGRITTAKDHLTLYLGITNAGFCSKDRSSDGCERYSLEELKSDLANHPKNFTGILHSLLAEFGDEIEEFVLKNCKDYTKRNQQLKHTQSTP